MFQLITVIPLAVGAVAGLESVAFGILNAIIFFIVYIFSHIAQSVYDYFIRNSFNPSFLFPGIGVGGISNTGVVQPVGFTTAWFNPTVYFPGEGIVPGIYKVNEDILGFIAIPMIFFMIVIQVFAVFFDILEGKLPVWREWFAKITVAVVLAVLSYWIAGAVLLMGYLPFYAVWTGFHFSFVYVQSHQSWMWSSGVVLLPQGISQFVGSGPQGVVQLIFLSVEVMVIFLLWFMVVLRNAIVLFLVAVLPIASMLLATNWTASIGKKLWRLFVELAFLPFFIALPLWIFSTLMWAYGAWPQGTLGAYMADMGFLIFALGMPYLFLEGIGMLQGMGFPSAGQAVSLGTQTGMMLAGVSASMAVGIAKTQLASGRNALASARQSIGMAPSGATGGAGGGSTGGGAGSSPYTGGGGGFVAPTTHVQNAQSAHQMQDQVGVKLPGIFATGRNFTQYAGSGAYLGSGILASLAVAGAYKLYHRLKARQGAKLDSLRTSTLPHERARYNDVISTTGGKRAMAHYRLAKAQQAHDDLGRFAHDYWDSPEAQEMLEGFNMSGSGRIFGMRFKTGDTLKGLMHDSIENKINGMKGQGLSYDQARNIAIFQTYGELEEFATKKANANPNAPAQGWGAVFHVKGDPTNRLPGSVQKLNDHEQFVLDGLRTPKAHELHTWIYNHRRDTQSTVDALFARKKHRFI